MHKLYRLDEFLKKHNNLTFDTLYNENNKF